MSRKPIMLALGVCFAVLAGCAQQEEEVIVVTPEPVFDKYGNEVVE